MRDGLGVAGGFAFDSQSRKHSWLHIFQFLIWTYHFGCISFIGKHFKLNSYNCNCYIINVTSDWGSWIAEWYHTRLWSSVHCTMPWAVSSSLGNDKLFFGPNHNIYTLFHYFYLIYLSWYYIICLSNLSLNCETEKGKLKKFIQKHMGLSK